MDKVIAIPGKKLKHAKIITLSMHMSGTKNTTKSLPTKDNIIGINTSKIISSKCSPKRQSSPFIKDNPKL
ncbi:hypothetical protein HMI54_001907, partial [Coelomomyces lativittatus]